MSALWYCRVLPLSSRRQAMKGPSPRSRSLASPSPRLWPHPSKVDPPHPPPCGPGNLWGRCFSTLSLVLRRGEIPLQRGHRLGGAPQPLGVSLMPPLIHVCTHCARLLERLERRSRLSDRCPCLGVVGQLGDSSESLGQIGLEVPGVERCAGGVVRLSSAAWSCHWLPMGLVATPCPPRLKRASASTSRSPPGPLSP